MTHYADNAAGRISSFDGLSKAELNQQLQNPLPASKLKKTSKGDLLALVEAEQNPAPKPTKPRVLEARVMCEAATKLDDVTPFKKGTKKEILASALVGGATIDELMAATGWSKDTVTSAFGWDIRNNGFGVERRADQTYHLLFPKGVKTLPVMASRSADNAQKAMVAACS